MLTIHVRMTRSDTAVISVLERYRKVNILTNITVNSHHSSTHTSIPVRSNHYLRECKVILTHSTAADSTVKVSFMSTVDELSYSTNRLAYATLPCSPAWSWTSSSTAYSRGSSAGSGIVTSYVPLSELLASHSCAKFCLAPNYNYTYARYIIIFLTFKTSRWVKISSSYGWMAQLLKIRWK